jgi:hypothetical protein
LRIDDVGFDGTSFIVNPNVNLKAVLFNGKKVPLKKHSFKVNIWVNNPSRQKRTTTENHLK